MNATDRLDAYLYDADADAEAEAAWLGDNATFTGSDNATRPADARRYNAWALALLVFPLLTLFGNALVIAAVVRERTLHSATNYFIVSLAVADLLVAVVVMPFGVYYLFNNGSWALPALFCDGYIAMDVACSTSSIFNLVAISVDRYIAVTQPIKYAKHKSGGRVWLTIALVWLLSAAIGAPVVLGLNSGPQRAPDQCLFYNNDYVIYSSLGSFYIPCVVMTYLYYSIFKAIRERAKKQRSAKRGAAGSVVIENVAQTERPSSPSPPPRPECPADTSNDDDFDELERGSEPGALSGEELPQAPSTRFMLAAVVEETGLIMANLASPIPMVDPNTNNDSGYVPSNVDEQRDCSPPLSPHHHAPRAHPEPRARVTRAALPVAGVGGAAARRRFRSAASAARFTIFRAQRAGKLRAKSFAKKEKKVTQTLAVVLGVFLFCWAPFFTCNVLDAVCGKLGVELSPGVTAFILTTWLGYINSFLNPVIYTIFNPEFRKAFRKILRCGV